MALKSNLSLTATYYYNISLEFMEYKKINKYHLLAVRLTPTDKDYFDELVKREMQLAKKKLTLRVKGVGKIDRFEKVYYSPEADDNLCGASVICDLDLLQKEDSSSGRSFE